MGLEGYLILAAGAASGGFINGLAGFGTALFALGFWLQIMPPMQAVSIVVVMSVMSGLQGVWLVRAAIWDQPRRLARFLLPGLIGIPLGVASLSILDARMLKLVIAFFLVTYGGFFIFRKSLPKIEQPTPIIDACVGFSGGVLGGLHRCLARCRPCGAPCARGARRKRARSYNLITWRSSARQLPCLRSTEPTRGRRCG